MADFKLASKDLQDRSLELNGLHYVLHHGPVRFTLAYAAAGTRLQLQWISADGKMVSISVLAPEYVLNTVSDTCAIVMKVVIAKSSAPRNLCHA